MSKQVAEEIDLCRLEQVSGFFRALRKLSPEQQRTVFSSLGCVELQQFRKITKAVLNEKYPHTQKKRVIAPRLRKGFTSDNDLVYFFQTMPDSNYKRQLLKQFFYALRVGETQTASYNPHTKLVRIDTLKEGTIRVDYLPFIEGTQILFDSKPVSKACLAELFRRHCKRLGTAYWDVYAKAKHGANLSRLSTHSLRITASNILRKHTGDPYKQKVFLRHSMNRIYGATSHYLEYPEEEMRADLNAAFKDLVAALVPKEESQ